MSLIGLVTFIHVNQSDFRANGWSLSYTQNKQKKGKTLSMRENP